MPSFHSRLLLSCLLAFSLAACASGGEGTVGNDSGAADASSGDGASDAGGDAAPDADPSDADLGDTGTPDTRPADTGTPDTGPADTGTPDTGPADTGTPDTGPADTGTPDTGPADTGTPDTGTPDTGTPDTGPADTGTPDTGTPDTGTPDTGPADPCPTRQSDACSPVMPSPAGSCGSGACQPLMIRDLEGINDSAVPDFDRRGYRAKAFTVCPAGDSRCFTYYSAGRLGSTNSQEGFYDGVASSTPTAIKLILRVGPASQCADPPVLFDGAANLGLIYDGGQRMDVRLPPMCAARFTLYVGSDGSTYYDAALTQIAASS